MRIHRSGLLAVAVFAAGANAAPVTGRINLGGYAAPIGSSTMSAATGLDVIQGASASASPGTAGGVTSFGAGSGSFAGLACASLAGSCGTFKDITNFGTSAPISTLLSFTTGTSTSLAFDLTSISSVTRTLDAGGGSLILVASGIIHYSGLDDTAGQITLAASGSQVTAFSAQLVAGVTTVPVPEPGTWALAAFGGCAVGLFVSRRKRRTAA